MIADDEKNICDLLSAELQRAGHRADTAGNGVRASALLHKNTYDAAVLDVNLPEPCGMALLREIRQRSRETVVVMMTAFGSIDGAVESMRLRADDYLIKPFDPQLLIPKLEQFALLKCHRSLKQNEDPPSPMVGESPAMERMRRIIRKSGNHDTTVLVTGESGTGKGVVARELHRLSRRSGEPFVHVDCASLPSNLVESELFGHEKGAFTDASAQKKGKFELAGRGTLFLDEISTLSPSLQSKLLVVLQDRTFERVGGTRKLPLEARVVAATNDNLEEAVEAGRFRADLYYRLNIIAVECPPLRERPEDIIPLAEHFLQRYGERAGKSRLQVDQGVWEVISRYRWPGNIRELENALESAAILAEEDCLTVDDLPPRIVGAVGCAPPKQEELPPLSLEAQEMRAIIAALENHGGHREKTARELGISRRTLQYKLNKYNLG